MTVLPQVASRPYPWPFDGPWSTADTVLLCLAVQNDPVAECGADDLVVRLAAFVASWRDAGGIVIHGRRGYDPAVGLPAAVTWRTARRSRDRVLPMDDPGWEIAPAVAPRTGEPIVDHSGDNAFIGTDLAFLLARGPVRNLIVGGMRTETVVHATMRAANDQGFECLLLEDGTATDLPGAKETIFHITRFGNGLFGVTAPIAAVVAALGNRRTMEAAAE